MSHADTFWKYFWMIVGILTLLYIAVILVLIQVYNPTKTADAAAVGIIFDDSVDPFERGYRADKARPPFTGEYFYDEALPLAFADWSWGVRADWASGDRAYEGTHSIKIDFLQDWAGARINAADIDIRQYDGLSLAIFPDSAVGDLYIQLFDSYGHELDRQSLGYYTASGHLVPNTWNTISVPFSNLMPEGEGKRKITGLAFGSDHPGTAFFDSIKLETTVTPKARWHMPIPVYNNWTAPAPKPIIPVSLPYTLSLTPKDIESWQPVFGRFELTGNGVRIGAATEKTTGSMTFIAGGKDWRNYHVDTRLYWGQTSAFSILLRFFDDANFVSCAFSHYNETVQIYEVRKGVSTLIAASPSLAIRATEPWKNAHASAEVKGSTVTCLVDGEKALSADLVNMPANGTVGIETWTRNTYDSPHTLESLSVNPL